MYREQGVGAVHDGHGKIGRLLEHHPARVRGDDAGDRTVLRLAEPEAKPTLPLETGVIQTNIEVRRDQLLRFEK